VAIGGDWRPGRSRGSANSSSVSVHLRFSAFLMDPLSSFAYLFADNRDDPVSNAYGLQTVRAGYSSS
jgi:hypothetical protein